MAMKTRNYLSIIAIGTAVMMMLCGCAKELRNDMDMVKEGRTVVTAGLPDTKTYIGELGEDKSRKVYWENGDAININGTASEALAEIEEGTLSTTFTFNATLAYPYSALYPASAYKDASTITLAAVQDHKNGSFAQNALPMATYAAEQGVLSFSHLCSVVKLSLKAGEEVDEIKYVEFSGNNGEQVSGDFTIDYQACKITAASTAEADKAVRANVRKVLSAEAATEVYIVVPAGTYENGFTVKVVDVKGHYMTQTKDESCTFTAGKIAAMPEFVFAPTGTEVDVEIATAAELVAFAKDYNEGKYNEPFVSLIADIVFDENTSAEFESIGTNDNGNGGTNYFNGFFDGKNHTIGGYVGDKPLFAYTGGAGIIQDIIIGETCEYNVVIDNPSGVYYFAPLVMRHKGSVINCKSSANVTVSGTTDKETQVGGLVCRLVDGANVSGCSVSGTVSATTEFVSTTHVNMGGIIAYSSDNNTVVKDCVFSGHIDWQGRIENTANDIYLCVGGISARANNIVETCVVEADDDNVVINIVSTDTRTALVGGVVGYVTKGAEIKACTNNSKMYFGLIRGDGDRCRYIKAGGIVGHNNGSVTSCVNNGVITSGSDVKMQYIGGIAGVLDKESFVSGNVNGNTNTFNITGGVRQLFLGGLYGQVTCSTVLDFTAESDVKTANVNIEKHENSSTVYLSVGGLIGNVSSTNTLEIKAPKVDWKLNVTVGTTLTDVQAGAVGFGGVIGSAGTIVTGSEEGGHLKVSDAVCAGSITLTGQNVSGYVQKYATFGAGGVAGYVSKGGASFTNCTNNMTYAMNKACATSNGNGQYVGGIVGYIFGGESSISDCTNAAGIRNQHYNNNAWTSKTNGAGGIIGAYGYKTSEGTITISSCTNTASIVTYRGMAGGIAGYVRNGEISDCENTGDMSEGSRGYAGGIVGVVQKTTIDNCVAKCNVTGHKAGSATANVGGIVGNLNDSSVCKNSKYYGIAKRGTANATDYVGGIAGLADNTCSITGCMFGGSVVKGSESTTIDENNVNAYAVESGLTVTDCQYWDGN